MEALPAGVASSQRQLAPGLVAMTGWTVLAFLSGFVNVVAGPALRALGLGPSMRGQMAVQVAVFVGAALLAHRSYVQARRAIAADPGLAGGWYVENAWWVLVLATAGLVMVLVTGYVLFAWQA